MREIKFRAFDKETKELSHDFLSKNWLKVCIESPYVVLMQYTGLKDRNGVEIYEGDIVTLPIDFNAEFMQAVIEWEFNGWKFKWLKRRVSDLRGKLMEPVFHNIKLFEVIGNIFDNPELLEG